LDDKLKNNLFQATALRESGVEVRTAESTDEAMKSLATAKPSAIISDMGRWENGDWRGSAGLELIAKVREIDATTPIFIYASSGYARRASARREVLKQGTGLTDSPRDLFQLLAKHAGIRTEPR
jgi:CheY-like chemotaxis protein